MHQTYDISATYEENYERGPVFASAPPEIVEGTGGEFLGLAVRSRIGIAAGLLLNSTWIHGYAQRGFDLLTYKTVRSSRRPCYPLPNWVFVEPAADEPGVYFVVEEPPDDPEAVSSSVCFGMPSMAPEVWRPDVRRARDGLADGQVLLVSVVATPQDHWGIEEVARDFADCSRWAAEAGADVIEANFSCPNVCTAEGSIYLDAEASGFIAGEVRSAIGAVPLLIKTGHFELEAKLEAYLRTLDGTASGVTMVNCITGNVLRRDGRPAFGEKFAMAGVLGRAIHDPCVESVRRAAAIIAREKLSLAIAAVGGAACEADVRRYFEAGADAVMMGSAPMYLPDLAAELKRARPEWWGWFKSRQAPCRSW